MAGGGGNVSLADSEIEDLAQVIITKHMATFAIKYLGLPYETVENLKTIRQSDFTAFNRDLLVLWKNKNPGINQVQQLAEILFGAAKEEGFVDPQKIEKILGIPNPQKSVTTAAKTTEETITEAEFLDIAEKLKPHVERRMKIEPFPWLRDYLVDMDELYTELTLETIENKIFGSYYQKLENYKEIFVLDARNKVLFKADPGMGKTTLGKKIGYDWARGVFSMFSMIFFVFLKFVKPRASIEKVIIQQNPELEGLNVTQAKLRACFENFGNRCLIIFDGLDEHGLGQNEDVLKIIRNQKLLGCGIAVSSRPHSIREVQQYFPTIVQVDGFTKEEARKFVSKFLPNENEIEKIMAFKPSDSRESFPFHKCPILLSFLSMLVKEKGIDLSDTNILVGDLYLQMVQSMYKKFRNRKCEPFVMSDFVQTMKFVGNLALRTLLLNNPLLQKSKVFGIVGDFAFEYGFFAGHEDFRLCTDPTADTYVTYAHRSIEEFFGSFGFLQALDDGQSVDDILGSDCDKPIFMVNPLVLKFCLWLLSRRDLGFTHRDDCYEKLVSHVVNCIDYEQFDPNAIARKYPAIDIMKSVREGNGPEMSFFRHILERCRHINTFHVRRDLTLFKDGMFSHIIDQTDWIFGCLNKEVLDNLTLVSIGDYLPCQDFHKANTLIISTDIGYMDGTRLLDILLNKHDLSNRTPQVYLREKCVSDYNISTVISKHIKELHLWTDDHRTLMALDEIPFCPVFTFLKVEGFQIHPSVPSSLTKAVNDGKLPNLRRMKLSVKSKSAANWPEFCYGTNDLTSFLTEQSDVQILLPKLTYLMLKGSDSNTSLLPYHLNIVDRFFTKQVTKLSVLKLVDIDIQCFSSLANVLKQEKISNLSELFVSRCASSNENQILFDSSLRTLHPKHMPGLEKVSFQRFIVSVKGLSTVSDKMSSYQLRELDITDSKGIIGSLSALLGNCFPTLQNLTLGDLNKEDMKSLFKPSEQGKLPNLRHLFIHGDNPATFYLFSVQQKWNQLLTLHVVGFNVLGVQFGYLASLQSLDLRFPAGSTRYTIKRCWPHLQTIKSDDEKFLSTVVEGVQKG